jgi:membrane protease YdiL (CAAX protease family)
LAEQPNQGFQTQSVSPNGSPEWAGVARFVALYFSLQFLTGLASLLIAGSGFFSLDPSVELGAGESPNIEIQSRILPGILAQVVAFLPGLGLIGLLVGKDAFVLGKLGNPLRLALEFFLVSMGCHIVHQIALWFHQSVGGFTPQPHPFTKLGHSINSTWIWIVLTFAACIAAPINEEIVFRKITSLWLTGPFGKNSLFFMAGFFSLLGGGQSKTTQISEQVLPLIWVGGLFVLTQAVKYSEEIQWMIASACLFSAIHSFAWPTPVPLFFFGIYQVLLMKRTGGILGPVLFHAWFNFLGVFGLLWEVYGS